MSSPFTVPPDTLLMVMCIVALFFLRSCILNIAISSLVSSPYCVENINAILMITINLLHIIISCRIKSGRRLSIATTASHKCSDVILTGFVN